MPKILSALTLACLIALPLVACSGPGDASCVPTKSGPHSSSVKVSGKLGEEPTVTMPPAFDVDTTERSVLIQGSGAPAVDGDLVSMHYAVFNAATGAEIEWEPGSTWSEGGFITDASQKNVPPGLYKSLHCAKAGERIVSAVPSSELFGHTNTDMSSMGIGATDTVVFIFDVASVAPAPSETPAPGPTPQAEIPHLDKANGTPVAPKKGFPTVTLADDGTPTVTIPDGAPPASLQLEVLKQGDGEVVAEGATVVVHYTGLNWTTGEVFDSSWSRGEPATFSTAGVIPGFSAAIVGQKIGSQVVVVIPPDQGYGPNGGNPQAGISATDVIVFVVDILGAA